MSNPDQSLPAPWIRVLAAVGGVLLLAGAIVVSNEAPASAAGLERFGSCGELRAHLTRAQADRWERGLDVAEEAAASGGDAGAPAAAESRYRADGDEGTNTQITGVDELDAVELLADGRSLVAREGEVWLVAADGRQVLARIAVPPGSLLTHDEERQVLWAVGTDWESTTLLRVAVRGDAFDRPEKWSVAGRLVDLRRSGGTVHLVVVDDDILPIEPGPASAGAEDQAIPFEGTSPVPCDQVLHSPLPGGPATTLVARFVADGALAPTAATEVVGAGDNVLVTDGAVYVSTPVHDRGEPQTGIHRFDAGDLTLTGSGSVPGRLLNQFSLDEHDGHLRAAITVGRGGFGMPMPIEDVGGPAVDPAVDTGVVAQSASRAPATATSGAPWQDLEPEPTSPVAPTTSTTEEPAPTTTEAPTTSTTAEPTTTSTTTEEPSTTTTTTEPTPAPVPPRGDGLNEIVVLDLEGSLDVVGRTVRFGHPGETLHGIRFAGDVAYAVTFLQTDPFYVVDLTDPTRPDVLGELEIPGFSAYLHPISSTEVVGFGPGPDGGVLARLFDVSDPRSPQVVDTVRIGDDSPIVHDHRALRTAAGAMLLPATDHVARPRTDCPPEAEAEAELDRLYRQLDEVYATEGRGSEADLEALERAIEEAARCAYPSTEPRARVVTLVPGGGELRLSSVSTEAREAQRALALRDGGFLLVGPEVVRVSADGTVEAQLA